MKIVYKNILKNFFNSFIIFGSIILILFICVNKKNELFWGVIVMLILIFLFSFWVIYIGEMEYWKASKKQENKYIEIRKKINI